MQVFAGHLQPIHHPWIPAPYRGTGHAFDRGNDECEGIPAFARMTSARGFRLSPE